MGKIKDAGAEEDVGDLIKTTKDIVEKIASVLPIVKEHEDLIDRLVNSRVNGLSVKRKIVRKERE